MIQENDTEPIDFALKISKQPYSYLQSYKNCCMQQNINHC